MPPTHSFLWIGTYCPGQRNTTSQLIRIWREIICTAPASLRCLSLIKSEIERAPFFLPFTMVGVHTSLSHKSQKIHNSGHPLFFSLFSHPNAHLYTSPNVPPSPSMRYGPPRPLACQYPLPLHGNRYCLIVRACCLPRGMPKS